MLKIKNCYINNKQVKIGYINIILIYVKNDITSIYKPYACQYTIKNKLYFMFNLFFIIFFSTFNVIELYKIAYLKFNTNLIIKQNIKKNSYYITLLSYIMFFLFFLHINNDYKQITIILFFAPIVLIIFKSYKNNVFTHIFYIFYVFFCMCCYTNNILIFLMYAELLSLYLFIFMYYNFTSKNTKQINLLFYLVNNIITTIISVIFLFIVFNNFGSFNINVIKIYMYNNDFYFLNFFLFIYIIMKLGQGPSILLKFKFYKNLNINDIFIYIFVYSIYIWPMLYYLIKVFVNLMHTNYIYILLLLSTYFIFNSSLIFNNIIDFLVFSTWTLTWYQLFYILIYV